MRGRTKFRVAVNMYGESSVIRNFGITSDTSSYREMNEFTVKLPGYVWTTYYFE